MKVKKSIAILGALLTIVFSLSACGTAKFENKRYDMENVPRAYFYTEEGFVYDLTVRYFPDRPTLSYEYNAKPQAPFVKVQRDGVIYHEGSKDKEYEKKGNTETFAIYYYYQNGIFFGVQAPVEAGEYSMRIKFFINDRTGYLIDSMPYEILKAQNEG